LEPVMSAVHGDWSHLAERGTMGAIRLLAWADRRLGRIAARALLDLTVAYYYLRERAWRGASRRHLEAVWSRPEGRAALGRRPGPLAPLLHYREFAQQAYDRMLLWGGGASRFQMDHEGSEHLFRLARERRGGLVLGAHLGSFDMARTLAREYGVALNIVMLTAHSQRINRLFEELDPAHGVRVVALEPGSVKTAFAVKGCLDRGELVCILADRIPAGSSERPIWIDFLGRRMAFPRSPFLLARLVGCPTLVSTCVRTGRARYFTRVVELDPGLRFPRTEREKRAEELACAFARELEAACLRHPYQWFNFYDPPHPEPCA
jgi:predicted LPLAT superfamily acyltransferase